MATQEQIQNVIDTILQMKPDHPFQEINQSQVGIRAVLSYLHQSTGEVTAGSIAQYMGVSTARVAVLLKKMVAKGLIEKQTATSDGRVSIVRLSPAGQCAAAQIHDGICNRIGLVIDRLGMERVLDFLATAQQIAELLPPPELDLPD